MWCEVGLGQYSGPPDKRAKIIARRIKERLQRRSHVKNDLNRVSGGPPE
ncbi:MAG: hypothetical protein QXR45_10535 [Candidatus Bathyarchaeia archaeon]